MSDFLDFVSVQQYVGVLSEREVSQAVEREMSQAVTPLSLKSRIHNHTRALGHIAVT
jgi:hypothetical protein